MKVIVELDDFGHPRLSEDEVIEAVTKAIHDEVTFGDLHGYGFTIRLGPRIVLSEAKLDELFNDEDPLGGDAA
jgi:hypothetical protein